MNDRSRRLTRAALGAAGGLVGTMAIQTLMAASQRWVPEAQPPIREDPGKFLVEKAEKALPRSLQERVPEEAEHVAARALGMGYGMTFGALYGALRPAGGNPSTDGLVLGTACWAAGYLGWLPALGLLPPIWKQTAPQAIGSAVEHLAYGVATVASYDLLRQVVKV